MSSFVNTIYISSVILLTLVLQVTSNEEVPEELHPLNQAGKCYCGVPNKIIPGESVNRIRGGKAAKIGEIPWQGAGGTKHEIGFIRQICGGILVGSKHVLSANHCFAKFPDSSIRVGIGYTDEKSRTKEDVYEVRNIIKHADYYRPTKRHDIAILELKEKVDLFSHPNIKPVCLPWKTTPEEMQDRMGVVSGWGDRHDGVKERVSVLQKTAVEVLNKDCEKSIAGETHICAGNLPRNQNTSCPGDSGGPLTVSDKNNNFAATLIGIVSGYQSPICGSRNWPGIYVDVIYHMEWLKRNVPDLDSCPMPPKAIDQYKVIATTTTTTTTTSTPATTDPNTVCITEAGEPCVASYMSGVFYNNTVCPNDWACAVEVDENKQVTREADCAHCKCRKCADLQP